MQIQNVAKLFVFSVLTITLPSIIGCGSSTSSAAPASSNVASSGPPSSGSQPVVPSPTPMPSSTCITGTVTDADGHPFGAHDPMKDPTPLITVFLEQQSKDGDDRVLTLAIGDAAGNFNLCSSAAGTYDILIVATNGRGLGTLPTFVTGIPTGSVVPTLALPWSTVSSDVFLNTFVKLSLQTTDEGNFVGEKVRIAYEESVGGRYFQAWGPTTSNASIDFIDTRHCGGGAVCQLQLSAAGSGARIAQYNPAGMTFSAASEPLTQRFHLEAFNPDTGQPTCTPSSQNSQAAQVPPGTTVDLGTVTFTRCK